MEANGSAVVPATAVAPQAAPASAAPPNWSQGNNGAGAPGGAGGGGGAPLDFNGAGIHQALQQQHMMLAQQNGQNQAGLQMGIPPNPQQAPTLNMMLQSMAAAAVAAGQSFNPMQSPPNSQAPPIGPGGGPGFLILPQTGMQGMHPQAHGKDLSPNSTPGLQQPPPAATPPNLMNLDLGGDQRQWMAAPPNPNLILGPRMINPNDKMDDIKALNELFHPADNYGNGQRPPPQQELAFNHQMQDMARLNPGLYLPAPSPPAPNMFQMPMQQHARPRNDDEDNGLNGIKKDELVIGAWNEDEAKEHHFQPQQHMMQYGGNNNMLIHRPPDEMKDHLPPVTSSGWGDPPPPNPSGSWGSAPSNAAPHQGPPPPLNVQPKVGNWSGPNYNAPPPPPTSGGPIQGLGGGPIQGMGGGPIQSMGGHHFEPRGRGGIGGPRGGYQGGRGGIRTDNFVSQDRGGFRGGRGIGRGIGRGRGGYGGPPVDHNQEKMDGKKSAIADTIAMMNKMKMEDKERKDARSKYERERKQEIGMENPEEDQAVNDGLHDEPLHRRNQRERDHRRGGGPIGVQPFRGGRGGAGMPRMPPPGPLFAGGQNMFIPPPGAPGLIPPNLDFGAGAGFGPQGAGFPYGGPGFYPIPGQGVNFPPHPGHFRGGYPGGPRGRGGIGGFSPFGGPFNPAMTGGGGRGMLPMQGGRGRGGRGGGRGGAQHHQPKHEDNSEKTNGAEEDAPETELNAENPGNDIDTSSQVTAAATDGVTTPEEPSKNLNSGQGTTKGQLALSAKEAKPKKLKKSDNLRHRLTQQLVTGKAECMVCLDKIKPVHATWDCSKCYQVFHIHCIKKWVRTQHQEDDTEGWRCPGCQAKNDNVPKTYRCFCRKMVDPPYDRRETPHSCGEVCGRPLSKNSSCPHKCTDLCHPGPCNPCVATTVKPCPCGSTKRSLKCSANQPVCKNTCGKTLNCVNHQCQQKCHLGKCEECNVQIELVCFCDKAKPMSVPCSQENAAIYQSGKYCCDEKCGRLLPCRNHKCEQLCHEGACNSCPLSPEVIDTCFCGKTKVNDRKTCTDPIPSCDQVCGKKLSCGPVGRNHNCQSKCHEGECPPCELTTEVKCRCGSMDKEMDCKDLKSRADDARCERRCNKKRSCGKHKCNQPCCIDLDHYCSLVCNKLLSCSSHRCQDVCHRGNCSTCPNVSFDELRCQCGEEVMYPPIPCGTSPPHCNKPCLRSHTCSHAVRHNCHTDNQCPPCTELTSKECFGKHEVRKGVVCHLDGLSCGRPCRQPLPCGKHRCIKACHDGACEVACDQPCTIPRESCGHSCASPCHVGVCPKTPCHERIKVKCLCGNLSRVVICCENEREYKRIRTSQLAAQMFQNDGNTVNISNDFSGAGKMKLDCNEECSQIERNRRMALALQIENPDISTKIGPPKYSDFVKDMAKREPFFAKEIHNLLSDLIVKTKETTFKQRSHEFDCMGREKRQFVHELAAHFGCTTQSFDAEPKRNVVATAVKEEVWLPSISVVEVAQGVRKAPVPKF